MSNQPISILTAVKAINAAYAEREPLAFLGRSGHAKTMAITAHIWKEIAPQYPGNFALLKMEVASMTPENFLGFTVPTKRDDGDGKLTPITVSCEPPIISAILATGCDYGILFLDEMAQLTPDMQKAIAQLLLEGGINGYMMPAGWSIIGAGNMMSDKSGAQRMLAHYADRWLFVDHCYLPVECWLDWATVQSNIRPEFVAFAERFPSVVFDSEITNEKFCTPRGLSRFAAWSHSYFNGAPIVVDELFSKMGKGAIGDVAYYEFSSFLRSFGELPTLREIIDNPQSAIIPASDNLSAQKAAQKMAFYLASEEYAEQATIYCLRLKTDLAVAGVQRIMAKAENSGVIFKSPTLANWINENRHIIHTINS